ncbi:MAG: hypothetical protein ABIF19_16175 [Planctomycetota bacterium]
MKTKTLWILLALVVLICAISFRTNNVISYGSLGFAVLSFLKMHSIERRKLEIEEERRSEEKAAFLSAYFHLSRKVRKLRIENNSKGEARNIKVLLDDQSLDEQHPLWWERQPQPTTKLSGYESRDYILRLPASKVPKIAKIYWADDVKENNVNECPLPLA